MANVVMLHMQDPARDLCKGRISSAMHDHVSTTDQAGENDDRLSICHRPQGSVALAMVGGALM
jgi:hypothetical protein